MIDPERLARGFGSEPPRPIEPHCPKCSRKLAPYVTAPAKLRCPGCKAIVFFGEVVVDRVEPEVGRAR